MTWGNIKSIPASYQDFDTRLHLPHISQKSDFDPITGPDQCFFWGWGMNFVILWLLWCSHEMTKIGPGIFLFPPVLCYSKFGEFFKKFRKMSWIYSQKTEISTNFPIFWTKKQKNVSRKKLLIHIGIRVLKRTPQ